MLDNSEIQRREWRWDALVLSVWAVWLVFSLGLSVPSFVKISGLPLLIAYAAWNWSFWRAAALFLLVAWVFSAFSLTPSGLIWLAMLAVYLVLKLAQFQFIIRHSLQFASLLALTSFLLDLLQIIFISFTQDVSFLALPWVLAMAFGVAFYGCIGLLSFVPLERLSVFR